MIIFLRPSTFNSNVFLMKESLANPFFLMLFFKFYDVCDLFELGKKAFTSYRPIEWIFFRILDWQTTDFICFNRILLYLVLATKTTTILNQIVLNKAFHTLDEFLKGFFKVFFIGLKVQFILLSFTFFWYFWELATGMQIVGLKFINTQLFCLNAKKINNLTECCVDFFFRNFCVCCLTKSETIYRSPSLIIQVYRKHLIN